MVHVAGGQFIVHPNTVYGRTIFMNDSSGSESGLAVLTLEGGSLDTGWLDTCGKNKTAAVINLNGGDFTAGYIQKINTTASDARVNLNGGTWHLTQPVAVVSGIGVNASYSAIFGASAANAPSARVWPGGAVFDVAAGLSRDLGVPLLAPEGSGVQLISVNARGAGYIAPPFVNITGGGGTGATAAAYIDRALGQVTDIVITSPGTGYTANPAVTLSGGGGTAAATVIDITTGITPAGGGLTKNGGGTLILNKPGTYRGPTAVNGGTLAAFAPGAIPGDSGITLNNGTLDLGGNTLTNAGVTLTGSGGILNGTLVTRTLRKDGPGTADLSASVIIAPAPAEPPCTPGLYEGRLDSGNYLAPNPRTSVQLSPRAALGYASSGGTLTGARWPNNSYYVYTGYLWNRQPTNVVWTFAGNFDDAVILYYDGVAVLSGGYNTTRQRVQLTITPGPHRFEVRLGQGSGSVGGYWTKTDGTRPGFGVDFQGRNQDIADNYEPIADPGDGSLFTTGLPPLPAAPPRTPPPAEVTANVGDLARDYTLIYDSDVPATGSSINSGNPYLTDNALADSNLFDRVAYYLDLTLKNGDRQWVWVSFDAHTADRAKIGYPTAARGALFQRKVDNMDVRSNVSGVSNVTGSDTGNIEFWPNSYSASTVPGLGLGGTALYDFDDTCSSTAYGSFQVHNWGDKTTLFAINGFGTGNSALDVGIGSNPNASSGTTGNPPQRDWTFAANANTAYTRRKLYVFTRDIAAPPPSATVAEGTLRLRPDDAAGIPAQVGDAAAGYEVVYAAQLGTTAAKIHDGTAYSIDTSDATTPFDRVAYWLELESTRYGGRQWVWVSFNAHTADRKLLGFPAAANPIYWQQKVYGMDVRSNVGGVNNVTGCDTGNLEIWANSYSAGIVSGLGLGGTALYDFDDTRSGTAPANGYGSFQIHNWGDQATLFAVNNFGTGTGPLDIGIGTNPNAGTVTTGSPPQRDWTFANNASDYTVRSFCVFVRTGAAGSTSGGQLAEVDLDLLEGGTLDLGGVTQAVHSVSGSGTVANGALAAGSVYRVKIEGSVCTHLTLDNVDVSNWTVVPADEASAQPASGTYEIASGVFTGKPALGSAADPLGLSFPSKYKLAARQGKLLLTSGGTLVILK
jgi:autotransporter-associated beta strand protein